MYKTFFLKKNYLPNGQNSVGGIQKSIYPNQCEINIADGGEFLDDGIRMTEQPFLETPAEQNE